MSDPTRELLIALDGSAADRTVLDYTANLAGKLESRLTVVSAFNGHSSRADAERRVQWAAQQLEQRDIQVLRELAAGDVLTVLVRQASRGQYLSVVAQRPRPLWRRLLAKSPLHELLAALHTPLLLVPGPFPGLGRILVCLGGLGYAAAAAETAFAIAARAGARLTLLHVIEPGLYDYLPISPLPATWEELVERDLPQAHTLRTAAEQARIVDPQVELKLRQGYVVHEIRQELRQGDYDLVAMGSHQSSSSLRQKFAPDVTVEIYELAESPILVAQKSSSL